MNKFVYQFDDNLATAKQQFEKYANQILTLSKTESTEYIMQLCNELCNAWDAYILQFDLKDYRPPHNAVSKLATALTGGC